VYWAATAAGFAFLIVDIFDDGAIWNYAVIVCIIIAIAVRPGASGDGAPRRRRTNLRRVPRRRRTSLGRAPRSWTAKPVGKVASRDGLRVIGRRERGPAPRLVALPG
jgi:hypothetical protein